MKLFLILAFLLLNCEGNKNTGAKRASLAKKAKGDISIGVSWSNDNSLFVEGLQLALDEVNKEGLINNRKVKLIIKDDEKSINKGLINAEQFSDDLNVVAVIGHFESYITMPASSVYEFNKIVMVTPLSTAAAITNNKYEYVFRTIPSDKIIGSQLAAYFHTKDYKNTMLCYVNSIYGLSFANEFESKAELFEINVKDRIAYDVGSNREFGRVATKWKTFINQFDSIMFVGNIPGGENFLNEVRKEFPDLPIVCGEDMVNETLLSFDDSILKDIYFPAIFHADENRAEVIEFREKFIAKHGKNPDVNSALAYDTLKIICEAIKKGKSSIPSDIAKNLKNLRDFKGVVTKYNFDQNGDLIFKDKIGLQKISNRKFTYIGRY